jgi:FtsZ-interacting cell division protein ZipA
VECPDPQEALKQARDLDAFCAGVDVAVGVNVVAEGGGMFPGSRIRELAQNAGFRLEPDGVFHYVDAHHRTLFTLDNHEPAPFLPERIKSLSTKGLTLLLDVPLAAAGSDALDRMIGIANEFAVALDGHLVDDNRAPLTDAGVARIREQVRSIHATMEARGIPAGSPRALRLFSG